jgi:hypothetical protein
VASAGNFPRFAGLKSGLITLFAVLLLAASCANQCIGEGDIELLLPPSGDEYRLSFTNLSSQMVELVVDGASKGAFCAGIVNLDVGNFPRNECSQITIRFFDIDRSKSLDDCSLVGSPLCEENNVDGKTCFDTTAAVLRVVAEIQ